MLLEEKTTMNEKPMYGYFNPDYAQTNTAKNVLTRKISFDKQMSLKYIQLLLFLSIVFAARAQTRSDTINYSLNTRLMTGRGTHASFLSTANQYDRYSFAPNSLTLWGTLHKNASARNKYDYGFGLELDGNISKSENRFFPNELYVQGKAGFLNLYAGYKQQVFGNQDAELSSGGMLWSQNSRPMLKITLETIGYITVPHTKGYLEIKGGLSHGWLNDDPGYKSLLMHHKYGYFRIGGRLPVHLSYGIQHVAQWGGSSDKYGSMPVTWANYARIFLGKSGNSTANLSDQINTLGNHIISQNLGFDVKIKQASVSFYWQNITEDPPVKFITNTPNIEDGLWGASIRIPQFKPLSHFVFEYVSTTDHNGPWHDLDGVIYGGLDSYYTNGLYPNGWTYNEMTIGNPWLTSPRYNTNGSTTVENNTIRLYYFSGEGKIRSVNYRITLAKSKNYGETKALYDSYLKQFSWQVEGSLPLKLLKNTKINLGLSGDNGEKYGNNTTFFVGFSFSGQK